MNKLFIKLPNDALIGINQITEATYGTVGDTNYLRIELTAAYALKPNQNSGVVTSGGTSDIRRSFTLQGEEASRVWGLLQELSI